jgi:demethylmenaquinone methyltransferase/2-methoxy-6-polyprenyl-1,4-benzoquinol methylase
VTAAPVMQARPDGADLPVGPAKVAMVRTMFDAIAPRYDLVNRLMTFGLDIPWRHRTVRALGLPPGSRVVDVGCGTGDLSRMLAHRGLRALGVDLSLGMLRAAPSGPVLVQADALRLPVADGAVDGVTSGFALRNVADLDALLAELARVVRPGGRIALLEVDEPRAPLMRLGHRIWFSRVVPAIGALLSDADAYRYLPRSVAYLPSPEHLRAMLRAAGFRTVGRRSLGGGVAQLLTATRAGDGRRDAR